MTEPAFQDQIPGNHCWGCGPLNAGGLHIKSHWDGDTAVCRWKPHPDHAAGPTTVLNGGIIATILDCHSVCTAIADAYRADGRPIGSEPLLWYVTAQLDVTYRRPVPIDRPVLLHARVRERSARKTILTCALTSEGEERATAEVVAVQVTPQWSQRS